MAAIEDILIPELTFAEEAEPATPAANRATLFLDTADGILKWKADDGTVYDIGQGIANPMTTPGDMIVGGASGVPARLAAGTLGYPLVGGGAGVASAYAIAGKAHGCQAYASGSQTIGAAFALIQLNSEVRDTDTYHFTSGANLTGTVSKSSGSAVITGSGTSFTTELSVNQVVSIPGTATEFFVVKTVDSNTQFTAWQNAANNASGQTASRRNEPFAVPAGMGGLYELTVEGYWNTAGTQPKMVTAFKNNVEQIGRRRYDSTFTSHLSKTQQFELVPGDYVWMAAYSATNADLGTAAYETISTFTLIGT